MAVYHELREVSPRAARLLVRRVLEQQKGNVSKTARVLGISRKTVRRAREGPLEDLPRRPKNSPKRIKPVKALLRRHRGRGRRRKVRRGSRPLYDYGGLLPFSELQVDTKHILDQGFLPRDLYEHIRPQGLSL